jgi:hypothetical protein
VESDVFGNAQGASDSDLPLAYVCAGGENITAVLAVTKCLTPVGRQLSDDRDLTLAAKIQLF